MARLALISALVAALAATAASARGPSTFSPHVTNPWFPLTPGRTLVYRGTEDGDALRDVLTVTGRTRVVAGVRCRVVEDRLFRNGRLAERTTDWYAQHRDGSVWYFGEETAEIGRDGRATSTKGSWEAGVDGARAGLYMPSRPRVGQSARQEYYRGQAEDHFRVVALRGIVRVPAVSSTRALVTKEWTPLEPGVVDRKVYVRGIGTVLEQTVQGGDELLELVAVRR